MLDPSLQRRSKELGDALVIAFTGGTEDLPADAALSRVASSLAMEHWLSALPLMGNGFLSAAAVLHRAQYEAVLRSIWIWYAASESQLRKLATQIIAESVGVSDSLAQHSEMFKGVEASAPAPLVSALKGFKDNSWRVLSSYAHAGLHPIRAYDDGYPAHLFEALALNANGVAMVGAMHTASLTGDESLMKHVHSIQFQFSDCFAPK